MPPKKDKKKTKAKKPKKMRLSVMEPSPKFATGFNRVIPGGVIGTGGGGGYVPSSFSVGGYASRVPPPASPIQTHDQFAIQRNLASQATAIESIVEEQKEAKKRGARTYQSKADELGISREEYSDMMKAKRIAPETPTNKVSLKDQVAMQSPSVSMADAEAVTGGGALEPNPNIKKSKKKYKIPESGVITMPPPRIAPPVIGTGEQFPGGLSERQQGLMMGVPGRLRTPAPDASQSLVGLDGIGEAGLVIRPPTSGLQDQGAESGV